MRIRTRLICPALLALIWIPRISGAESGQPRELLFLPWNDAGGRSVEYRADVTGRFGPQSFRVAPDGSSVTVLDATGGSLKTFRGGELVLSVPAPDRSRDFVVGPTGDPIFLLHDRLLSQRDGIAVGEYALEAGPAGVAAIDKREGTLVLRFHDGNWKFLASDLTPAKRSFVAESGDYRYQARRSSSSRAELQRIGPDGQVEDTLRLDVPTRDLGSLRVIGIDGQRRLFVDMNLIEQQVPLRVRREVWILAESGSVLGRIRIPTHYYTRIFRDLELHSNGDLYHMISAENGIHVFRWRAEDVLGRSVPGEYGGRFPERVHYNLEVAEGEYESEAAFVPTPGKSMTDVTVTRSQAIATGDTYVQHPWTATAANLSDGVETAPDGDLVQTPSWIVIGANQTVPYKWGGFDSLAGFDSGIAVGHYAGDIHTDGPSDYARGVDCSGFVSRCWNLVSHYTTRMMDDPDYGPITLPYASWAEIQAGDAIHRPGHVRMAVDGLQDGSFLVLESAGSATDWRVGYSVYTLAELEDYSPRYYIGMDGAPGVTTIVSTASGSWTAGSTWVGGVVPTAAENVLIAAGHTISVDDADAECRSLFFGGDDALIDMNANSLLSVYGDFTIHSASHVAFSAGWSATDAHLRFAGPADQTLGGFSTSGGSTSLRDVIVDKEGGRLTTQGNGMRLGIQNSLEIVNGVFELAPGDDLEGRWASSGNYQDNTLPDIIVRSGGEFCLLDGDGAHHIRSSDAAAPIGTVTVFGRAEFRDASSLLISLEAVDVEDGGLLVTNLGMGGGEFDCGPVHVKAGGELENYTTVDPWGASASVTIDAGGLYDTKASVTIFPAAFTDNGTVRYSRIASTDQIVADRNYNNLEISSDADNVKSWTVGADRSITDGLTVNNGATLVLVATAPQAVTVGQQLFLTSGILDNSDLDVALTMADAARVQRATGQIVASPQFAGQVDVRYTSTVAQVTTGPELPAVPGVIDDFTVSGTQGVVLARDVVVSGVCTTSGSALITGSHTLNLADEASLVELPGATVVGTVTALRDVPQTVGEDFGGIGLEIVAAAAAPGLTTVVRTTGTARSVGALDGILRSFQVVPANNTGLDATLVFHYDDTELNGLSESSLALFEDEGGGWSRTGSTLDPDANTLTVTGEAGIGELTAAEGGGSDVDDERLPVRTEITSIHPNPFNPTTKVLVSLRATGPVEVVIFDIRGRRVRTLQRGIMERGIHELTWRGRNEAGESAATGTYFCRMIADGEVRTSKMMLIR